MTLREHLESIGVQHGLFESESKAIAQQLIDEEGPMAGRWDERSNDYPPQLMSALWHSFKRVAAKWLAENKPLHWARPVFDPSVLDHK